MSPIFNSSHWNLFEYGAPVAFLDNYRSSNELQGLDYMPGALCDISYPSEIHLQLKSREISLAHNSGFSWPIALKFCTEHGSIIAVLCAKFQTDWTIEMDVMEERVFARFEFKMSFGRISYIEQYQGYQDSSFSNGHQRTCPIGLSWSIYWQINPLRAKFFRGKINIYLHFMSLLNIDMTQVLKILPQVRPRPTYST